MIFIIVILILIILGVIYMRFEAGFAQITHVHFTKNKKYLKVIQLSDLHIEHLKVSAKRLKKIIDKINPDFIVITGDYINNASNVSKFMDYIDDFIGQQKIYMCLGNHDQEAFKDNEKGLIEFVHLISERGITVLNDTSTFFEKHNRTYNIIGFTDIKYSTKNVEETLKNINENAFKKIAICHNPDIILDLPEGCVDYLFCGHFHGGQIWMPFQLEFKTLRTDKLCKVGITRGLHTMKGINLYINRGLGNVLFPLRFLSRPEITVFYIP